MGVHKEFPVIGPDGNYDYKDIICGIEKSSKNCQTAVRSDDNPSQIKVNSSTQGYDMSYDMSYEKYA